MIGEAGHRLIYWLSFPEVGTCFQKSSCFWEVHPISLRGQQRQSGGQSQIPAQGWKGQVSYAASLMEELPP